MADVTTEASTLPIDSLDGDYGGLAAEAEQPLQGQGSSALNAAAPGSSGRTSANQDGRLMQTHRSTSVSTNQSSAANSKVLLINVVMEWHVFH